MSIQSATLFQAYEKTAVFVQKNAFEQVNFHAVQTMFEDKRRKADAHIMVYGVYNAGKSTLINALLGKEVAETGDVPLTDTVTAYRWLQYDILDTPGVDAPIEHQRVTENEMLKADAVIFVVNPIGAAEEQATLSKLLELVKAKKQVFLVFNEKQSLDVEDFLKLKEQTWARLQHMAEQAVLSDVLKEIPIVLVNAKSAFRGKTENKQVLLEKSGFLEFEKRLTEFLQQISSDEIYGRLKTSLLAFLSGSLNVLEIRSQANLVKKYDDLLKNMEGNKGKVRRAVRQEIHNERASIHGKIQGKLRSAIFNSNEQTFNSDDFENYIQNTFECSAQRVTDVLESEVGLLIQQLQLDIEILQAEILKANIPSGINTINIQDIQGETQSLDISALNQQHISQISPEAVTKAIGELAELAKPEHIVAGLKIVKTYLPSLMKGIGTKTMEKWATAIAQKIPYAGTLIQVGLALYEIFSGDKQANQMQDAINEQNRQRERAMQQIDDSANEVASQFENAMREQTGKIIDEVFANVTQQIHALRQGFSDDERQNSEWLEQLSSYQVLAQSA